MLPPMALPPLRLFLSYASEDEIYQQELTKHLSLLQRTGVIKQWHARRITAGSEWKRQIDQHLEEADVIVILVSADFLSSDYCNDVELERSLARHREGSCRVIPVIVRPT